MHEGKMCPVAIKVLSDRTDPQRQKELVEEARLLATVSHLHCVRYLIADIH